MIRALNCALFILIILLTAIFGLIALLIIATEQPESLFDKLNTSKSATIDKNTIKTTPSVKVSSSDDRKNSTVILFHLSKKLKLANNEKVMSIGVKENTFYAAKVNGEIEFFNWTNLESLTIENLDVPIHRMDFFEDDGRFVVTETQNKTLRIFDENFKVVVELKLGYQALDLRVFDDMVSL